MNPPENQPRRPFHIAIFVALALIGGLKLPSLLEGYFRLPIAPCVFFPRTCIGWGVGGVALLYMIIKGIFAFDPEPGQRFWTRKVAISCLIALFMLPVVPFWRPYGVGYWLRVRTRADIPAILVWADSYTPSEPTTNEDGAVARHRQVEAWIDVPHKDLPSEVSSLGVWASIRTRDRVVRINNSTRVNQRTGVVIGHGIGRNRRGILMHGADEWLVNDDAYVEVMDTPNGDD